MEIDRLPRKKPAWFLTRREQVVQRYDAVKGSFDREPCKKCADKIATLCKNCRTSLTRGISWSPRTVPDMADDVGRQLRNVFALAYTIPTFYLHVSDWSVAQQMSPGPNGVP